jgi:inorganic pyrophosphatase
MVDFNQVLDAGDWQNGSVNTVIEISKGSIMKIEYRRDKGYFELDRLEPGIFAKPCNYGFIPQTLDEDGDELDTLVLCDAPLPMSLVVRVKVVGVLNFSDDGEMDHKVVCVLEDDRHWGNDLNTLDDIASQWKKQIEHHFTHYKDLKKPGSTKVLGWGNVDEAKQIIKECIDRWKQQ